MGIADIDFKAAPSITKAINDRVKHENWGYLDMNTWTPKMQEAVAAWNKRHYGITIEPSSLVLSNGVHPMRPGPTPSCTGRFTSCRRRRGCK